LAEILRGTDAYKRSAIAAVGFGQGAHIGAFIDAAALRIGIRRLAHRGPHHPDTFRYPRGGGAINDRIRGISFRSGCDTFIETTGVQSVGCITTSEG
jgi:hypothetical protein